MNDKDYTSFLYFDRRTNEEDMPVRPSEETQRKYEEIEALFDDFFEDNSLSLAKQSSKEERDKKGLNDSSYVYGEITFRSIAYIIEYIKSIFGENSIRNSAFVDLGSGIGRAVVACACLYPFTKCIGIEYLEMLHNIGLDIKSKYDKKFEEIYDNYKNSYFENFKSIPQVELINGDFLKTSWSDASLILANSTCFSNELMSALAKKADEELQQGAFFVTFTKKLPGLSEKWEIKDGFRRLMSWGIATIYVHHKKL